VSVSLRWKVLLFVAAVSASFVSGTLLVQRLVLLPEFSNIEQQEIDADLRRCEQALQRDLDFLARTATDYAAWDDTYQYAAEGSADYEGENLVRETFDNLDVDVLVLFREDGNVQWSGRRTADAALAPATDLTAPIARMGNLLLGDAPPDTRRSGIVQTARGPLLVGTAAISTTDRRAPSRGTFVIGRFADDDFVKALAERTGVALALHPLGSVPEPDRAAITQVAATGSTWHDRSDPELVRAYQVLDDAAGRPVLLLRADLPRRVMTRARTAATWSTLSSVAAGALISILTWLALTRMIVGPLLRVTRHAVRVGEEGDLRSRLDLPGSDEIAVLAREFDRMVGRLATSQAELVQAAHGAGRAEIAINVLHNVGNVLNGAGVAADRMARTVADSELASLGAAADLLRRHEADLPAFLGRDERGRHLPVFLSELSDQLASEHATLEQETKALVSSIGHVREILRAQNELTRAKPLIELVEPAAIVDEALVLVSGTYDADRIRIEKRVHTDQPARLDRHRVLQILTNLLANALHAVGQVDGDDRKVAVEVDAIGSGGLRFRVVDNGMGIAPEDAERIFAMGFTTRAGGLGIGLHSAANQAREMGGDLGVESAGRGHGAAFSLTIPIPPAGARP
jgi:sensor domain CHASE-containing protein